MSLAILQNLAFVLNCLMLIHLQSFQGIWEPQTSRADEYLAATDWRR